MTDLSVLIPARAEMFLGRTVEDVLEHSQGDTEIIVVLDGAWPDPGLPVHERVTVIHRPVSIGQRAATNEAARVSDAKYVMKLDAHCGMAPGFDVELMRTAEELGEDVTIIPGQFNGHIFQWCCGSCGHETYQGPTPDSCEKCGKKHLHRKMVWKRRKSRYTTAWRADSEMHFQYHGARKEATKHEEISETMTCLGACWFLSRERFWALGGLDEDHGSWGALGTELGCKSWLSGGRMVTDKRAWFFHMFRRGGDFGFPYPISGRDQRKAKQYSQNLWLKNAWPGQVRPLSWLIEKFKPLPDWHEESGAKCLAEVAEAGVAFTVTNADSVPVSGSVLGSIGKGSSVLGAVDFPTVVASAEHANTERSLSPDAIRDGGEIVPATAMSLPGVDGGAGIAAEEIRTQTHEPKVRGIAAANVVADGVVNLRDITPASHGERADQPSIDKAVAQVIPPLVAEQAISRLQAGPGPVPAASAGVDADLGEEPREGLAVEVGDCEKIGISHSGPPLQATNRLGAGDARTSPTPLIIPHEEGADGATNQENADGPDGGHAVRDGDGGGSFADRSPVASGVRVRPTKGIVYYSCCGPGPVILEACRRQLRYATNGHEIVSVTLKPVDFGDVRYVMAHRSPGILSMFRQILAGLELSSADVVFLCEHDCAYHPSHFDFVPPSREVFYFNVHTFKLRAEDGHALHYLTKQTSGLCAYRELLVGHYRRRVAKVEQNARDMEARGEPVKRDGYSRHMGFEPGCHSRPRGVDDYPAESWMSEFPNVDIRHGHNLTPNRWSRDQFRSKRSCLGWTEADEIPGWGKTKGRFDAFLSGIGG